MNRQVKLITILLAGLFLGIIFIFLILRDNGNGLRVNLITVPDDMQLTFQGPNNTNYTSKGKGSIKLPIGSYDITATSDGFKEKKLKLVVKENDQKLVVLLEPESREAREWAQKNERKYLDAEKIAGEESQKAGEEFRNANPIISKLPYSQGFYRIDYGQDGENIILYITADQPVGRVIAMSTIRDWGYEPADYDIRFYNFDNPFKEGNENE